jgi:glycerol-3-phosphate acyltransferase PlsY
MADWLNVIIIIFISYILGSIPFSYLITKIFAKKNIFELGWKKSSSSNVVKNVGKLPGLISFLLDVGKGFLTIYLAQKLGFASMVQVFCGVAAIVGHNWSIFVGGKGGRGLATLIGVLTAFSPIFTAIAIIPCIFFTLIWTASIGTIISLIFGVFLGLASPSIGNLSPLNWQPAGYFILFSLVPIFIKRLSPWQEIFQSKGNQKIKLIKNRLLFDQDGVPALRLKINKEKKK